MDSKIPEKMEPLINKKVLLIGNFLTDSNANRGFSEELAIRLISKGWSLITASNRRRRAERLIDMIYTVWNQKARYNIAHVDVFSGIAFFWAEAVCWTLQKAGKPFILTLRGGNLPGFAQCWPRRTRRLLSSAAVITSPSNYLIKQMNTFRDDVHLLPNAIDLNAYKFYLRERPRPRLVWLRAFHEIYNPTLAVQILAILAKDIPDIQLIMIGPDKGDGSFHKTKLLAEQLDVMKRIDFPGGISKKEVPMWINKGDVFLNTTNVDNTPISVLEAMACGLCIVSTNVGGIPYLLEQKQDALLVPPKDPDAMAGAVKRVLNEAGLAERLSLNSRKKAENFDWSIILAQWDELLSTISTRNNS